MTQLHFLLASALVLGGTLVAAPAHATEGAVQLGIGTPFLVHTNATLTEEAEVVGESETERSTTAWGLGHNLWGEVGYGVSDSLVLGAFVQLAGTSLKLENENGNEADGSQLIYFIGPKLDFMFMPGSQVRPFIGAVAGLYGESTDSDTTESSLTGFQLHGRAGLRAFVTESFSLDPAFFLAWATASGERENPLLNTDLDYSAVSFGVTLGLSGWIL